MKNSHLGILLVLAGVITVFVKHESAWIISAILIGGGTGIFFLIVGFIIVWYIKN